MAISPKSQRGEERGLRQEIIGIALLALSLYVAVCLWPGADSNPGGVVGEYLSWAFKKTVGYTSYIFPLLILALSLKYLLRKVLVISYAVPAAIVVLILSVSAMLGGVSAPQAGGVVGGYLNAVSVDLLGTTGAFIILTAIALISIVVATGVSLIQAGVSIIPPALTLARTVAGRDKEGAEEEGVEDVVLEDEEGPHGEERPVRVKKEAAPAVITPVIHNIQPKKARQASQDEDKDEHLEFSSPKGTFKLPPTDLLDPPAERTGSLDSQALLENTKVLEKKLLDFGIEGRVLDVRPGPVVTMYEFEPASGVKVNKIVNLSDDLALALKAMSIRIIAPIPGKSVVGIEVPNEKREMIHLRELLEYPSFGKSKSRLSLALGKDISGNPFVADFARMPHLLVAGATGAGKSVSVNAMILSILFKSTPEDVRFLMVDPKMLELSAYEGIPHLITPVITEPKKAASALRAIVAEMGKRYKLMALRGAKNIEMYNHLIGSDDVEEGASGEDEKRLPYIVVVIDELADLMMTSGKDVEDCLVRLSQMARAAGIHLLVATQRPSVDVVTGLIKTNFPARIAFQLPSRTDSRTILDASGAETLLGEGDMLFLTSGSSKLQRIHGAFVSEAEIKKVTDFWKRQGSPEYDEVITGEAEREEGDEEDLGEGFLKRYDEALELAAQMEMISTSYLQRRFRIGYNTAARIIEKMEKDGIVGPAQGSRPREVLKRQ